MDWGSICFTSSSDGLRFNLLYVLIWWTEVQSALRPHLMDWGSICFTSSSDGLRFNLLYVLIWRTKVQSALRPHLMDCGSICLTSSSDGLWFNLLHVLIWWTKLSVLYPHQTRRQSMAISMGQAKTEPGTSGLMSGWEPLNHFASNGDKTLHKISTVNVFIIVVNVVILM